MIFCSPSIQFKGQSFTFDHVFGMDLSQTDLYTQTASPMLKSFLEGYNVTIIAYGQTGSGKTYTMGTSDAPDGSDCQGLIPRFLNDLFENLKGGADGEQVETKIQVSFIEIYGEDIYDLLNRSKSSSLSLSDKLSLPIREDDSGRVFVQGVNEMLVESAAAALDYLSTGTRNRVTASTAMNAGSSRSHAVFTVSLQQSTTLAASASAEVDAPQHLGRVLAQVLYFLLVYHQQTQMKVNLIPPSVLVATYLHFISCPIQFLSFSNYVVFLSMLAKQEISRTSQ